MFVSTKRFKRNLKINIYDKQLPMGNTTERCVLSFLERLVSPKGNCAYKFFQL